MQGKGSNLLTLFPVLYMIGIYIISLRFSLKISIKYSSLGQVGQLRAWVLLNPRFWAAGRDLLGKVIPTSKIMSWELSGSIQEVRTGKLPLPSMLSGLQWGAGEMWKWIKVPRYLSQCSPKLLPTLYGHGPKAGPCPARASPAGEGRAWLVLLTKDQVRFNLNKQELKMLQNPSRKLSVNSLHVFSVFLPYQSDFSVNLLCCLF